VRQVNYFSELYGAYFRTVAKVLSEDRVTEKDIYRIISETAFRDSALFIPEKLLPQRDGTSVWGLLKRNGDGSFSSVLSHMPPKIVTELQKRWLKAKLADPRFRLFMTDAAFEALSERLKDVTPLYNRRLFRYFDVFSNGDDYESDTYRKSFRAVLQAAKRRETVQIGFLSRNGEMIRGDFLPLKIEYSKKNDKFRAYCLRICGGRVRGSNVINIGRIAEICHADSGYIGGDTQEDTEKFFAERRCREPVTVEVSGERNGMERFMMEFAAYEKQSELDLQSGICTAKIWYDGQNETELLIQLLSFGPVLKILGPEDFRRQAAERVKKQHELNGGQ